MKKIILSLSALLSVGIASAQSYPKQPDPSAVTYIEYKKVAKEESVSNENQQVIQAEQTEENRQDEANVQPAASVNGNAVSDNRKNNKAKKE